MIKIALRVFAVSLATLFAALTFLDTSYWIDGTTWTYIRSNLEPISSHYPTSSQQHILNTQYIRKLESPALPVLLWACGSDSWESDFLAELFPHSSFVHINLRDFDINGTIVPQSLVYNIENAGDDAHYDVIRAIITKFKVKILVHLSDEFQGSGRKWKYGEGVEVYHMVPLVLRQYSVSPYRSFGDPRSNLMQIPLGYMMGMLKVDNVTYSSSQMVQWSLSKNSSARNISWSFLGTTRGHKDRSKAIEIFSEWTPFVHDAGLTPVEMREIYNSSKFVLVGRGQSNLDCFRIYEAIISGALPIVVGPQWELIRTFEFEGMK